MCNQEHSPIVPRDEQAGISTEPTPEMIAAGERELIALLDDRFAIDLYAREIVRTVFRKMAAAANP